MAMDLPVFWVLLTLFFSTLMRATFGFGDALIAMPLLVLLIDLKTAVPLVAMVAMMIALSVALKDWRSIHLKSIWQWALTGIIGFPIGLYFLKGDYDEWMKGILALVIIGIALYNLLQPTLIATRLERFVYVIGLLSGVLHGAYNAGGPPLVIYAALKKWPPPAFRGTLQGYSVILGFFALIGHYFTNLWTPVVLQLFQWAFPVACLAILIGLRLHRVIPSGHFNRFIYLLLLGIGFYLLFQTIKPWLLIEKFS